MKPSELEHNFPNSCRRVINQHLGLISFLIINIFISVLILKKNSVYKFILSFLIPIMNSFISVRRSRIQQPRGHCHECRRPRLVQSSSLRPPPHVGTRGRQDGAQNHQTSKKQRFLQQSHWTNLVMADEGIKYYLFSVCPI